MILALFVLLEVAIASPSCALYEPPSSDPYHLSCTFPLGNCSETATCECATPSITGESCDTISFGPIAQPASIVSCNRDSTPAVDDPLPFTVWISNTLDIDRWTLGGFSLLNAGTFGSNVAIGLFELVEEEQGETLVEVLVRRWVYDDPSYSETLLPPGKYVLGTRVGYDVDHEVGVAECTEGENQANGLRFTMLTEDDEDDVPERLEVMDGSVALHPIVPVVITSLVKLTCDGLEADDPKRCSSHGSCVAPDECLCTDPVSYSGDDCGVWQCFNLDNVHSEVCSGPERGTCVDVDECECSEGFGGESCERELASGPWYSQVRYLVAVVLGTVCCCCCCLCCCCCCYCLCCRKKNKNRGPKGEGRGATSGPAPWAENAPRALPGMTRGRTFVISTPQGNVEVTI